MLPKIEIDIPDFDLVFKLAKEAKSKIKELNRESIILENLIDLILDRSN